MYDLVTKLVFSLLIVQSLRFLYWTDVVRDRIEKSSMDGSNRTVLHSTGLSTVFGLTLDYDTQILYWADYSNNQIEMSYTNGSNRMVLRTGLRDPFSITYYAGRLYWTDWYYDRIYSLSVSQPTSISQVIGSQGNNPYGIIAVTEERQPEGSTASQLVSSHYLIFSFCILCYSTKYL